MLRHDVGFVCHPMGMRWIARRYGLIALAAFSGKSPVAPTASRELSETAEAVWDANLTAITQLKSEQYKSN
jgi:hypothetical protein